jgi:hypothetical protein
MKVYVRLAAAVALACSPYGILRGADPEADIPKGAPLIVQTKFDMPNPFAGRPVAVWRNGSFLY